jgi:hypothetical protein
MCILCYNSLKREVMIADEEGFQLSWTRRMKIIIGIARGLKYLHTEIEPPFTISELNSNAIYLTEDFSPKVRIQPCSNFLTYIRVI